MNDFWDSIKYFVPDEFDDPLYPGSGRKIYRKLVTNLDLLRVNARCKVIVHSSVGGAVDIDGTHNHADRSYHLEKMGCKAADIHLETDMHPRMQYRLIESVGFPGIGIYYDWYWDGRLLPIGFHVDFRPWNMVQRWVRRGREEYLYLLGRSN